MKSRLDPLPRVGYFMLVKGSLQLSSIVSGPAEAESRILPEVRISLIYLLFASAWIIVSDLLLSGSPLDESQSALFQSVKGLNFVVATSVLLFFVLRRSYGGWRMAEQRRLSVIQQARERFRNLCSHVQALREDDRIRISREIHDELGQLLTGIKMEVRMLENQLSDREDRTLNSAVDKLVGIAELVDATITSVQRIASDLRPSALDNLGLGTALIDEAGQFTQRSGIPCSIVVEEFSREVPKEVTTAAFRIFQEALTNVVRHAEARRVDARLSVEGNVLRLVIHDDGKGIDPAVLGAPTSLGLVGMLERAEHVGGDVIFTSLPNKGTDVVLTVPLATEGLPPLEKPADLSQ